MGGCNTYKYQYTVNSQAQLITLGGSTSTKKNCANSDDQLYVNGIESMYKYLISDVQNTKRLKFYSKEGNIGYALKIVKPGTSGPVIKAPPTEFLPFSDGNVLMLLLKRRDLRRAVVTI